jgi:nucleotide-binding universal stress UspA family protein
LLATDLSAECLRSAQYASALSEEFHSQLTLAHVVRKQPILEDQGVAKLNELVPAHTELRKHTRYSIYSGDPASELLRIAERTNADLIVMGVNETGVAADHAPWSTISNVIREARCAVMTVQPRFA